MKTKLVVLGLLLGCLAFAPSANAAPITMNFNVANDTTALGSLASYGTVTLALQANGSMLITLDMADGFTLIAGGGQPDVFGFNTSLDLLGGGFPAFYGGLYHDQAGPPPNNLDGFGSFNYSIYGPNVGSSNAVNTLSFFVVTEGGFVDESALVNANAGGWFFAAHVFNPAAPAGVANTGFVAVGTPTTVPEPASLLLLGTGLLGAGLFGRRRK